MSESQTNDKILEQLRLFIYDQGLGYTLPFPFLFKRKLISRHTRLQEDLRITGDDSDEFMAAFGKEFNVDVKNFRIGDYFDDEGDPILPSIIRTLFGKTKRTTKTLTIGQLEKSVRAGRLDEDVINS
jgi:acyl carrier protein